ncbi:MAG: leucine-rich repeat domain-containing protein [Firmicutes bacterium]|nr:leucine-rich repeat domain-containing protein [Bacillota bacterium]
MDKKSRRRVVAGGMMAVLLIVGLGLWVMIGAASTITLDLDGGAMAGHPQITRTGTMAQGNLRHTFRAGPRRPVNLENIVPIRPGYVFQGWLLDEQQRGQGTDAHQPSTRGITSATTLYADWLPEGYLARLHVNGIHVRNIDIQGGQSLDAINFTQNAGETTGWVIPDTDYYTFRGWEFKDLNGNRVTLDSTTARNHMSNWASNAVWRLRHYVWNDMTQEWEFDLGNPRNQDVSEEHPFDPAIYDMTFNAILEMREVAFIFHHAPGQIGAHPPLVYHIPGTELTTMNTLSLASTSAATGNNHLGWILDVRANGLVELNAEGGIASINRLGHDVDQYGAAADRARLDQFLATVFSPHEVIAIDPLLFYLSTNPVAESPLHRAIHFRPVFFGTGDDPDIRGASRYQLRIADETGLVSMRDITEFTAGDGDFISAQYAYLQGNTIRFTRPADRNGWTFSHFEFMNPSGGTTIHEIAPNTLITRDDPRLPVDRGVIFIMVWEQNDTPVVTFEHDWTRTVEGGQVQISDRIHLINTLEFENSRYRQEEIDFGGTNFEIEDIPVQVGDTITLPSVAMYAGAHLTFSHWETEDGIYAGRTGDTFQVDEALVLRAIWIDNRIAFAFDLNGGRNFTPDMTQMRGGAGATVSIPTQMPTRFGYDFQHWTVGSEDYHPTNPDLNNTITAQARRTVLVAQWEPIDVDLTLEYTYAIHGVIQPTRSIPLNVEFDTAVRLHRIDTPSYNSVATLIGWRFVDSLTSTTTNLNMDFSPTDIVRIDESFASRATGDSEDDTLRADGITGHDLKIGRLFNVDFFDNDGIDGRRTNTDSGFHSIQNMLQWRSSVLVVDPNETTGLRPIGTHFEISREAILNTYRGHLAQDIANGMSHTNWLENRLVTHELYGVLYMERDEISSRGLTEGVPNWMNTWRNFWDVDNGSIAHTNPDPTHPDSLRRWIYAFDNDGFTQVPAPTGEMNLYLVWKPRAISVEVRVSSTVTETWTSYYRDMRNGTSLTDPTFVGLQNLAMPGGYMFSHWRATFIWENPVTGNEIRRIENRMMFPNAALPVFESTNWLFGPGNATLYTPAGAGVNARPHSVTRIILEREIQEEDSLVVQVVDINEFDNAGRVLYGVDQDTTANQTVFSNAPAISGFINFRVDPHLRRVAAQNGQQVVAYVTTITNAAGIQVEHFFEVGQNISIVQIGDTFGHSHTNRGENTSLVAQINSDLIPFLQLRPITQVMNYRVVLNWQAQDQAMNTTEHSQLIYTGGSDPFQVGTFIPVIANATLATLYPLMNGGAWGQRFGYFMHTFDSGLPNIGFRNAGVITPQFRLGPTNLGFPALGIGTGLDVVRVERNPITGEYDTLNLWVNWAPRTVFINYVGFIQDDATGIMTRHAERIPVSLFGQTFPLATTEALMSLGVDIRHTGFNHTGWNVFEHDQMSVYDFTTVHHSFSVMDGSNVRILGTGNAAVNPANRINNAWFRNFGDLQAMELHLNATYTGIMLPGITLQVIDLGPTEDPLADAIRAQYDPLRPGVGGDNRFDVALNAWNPISPPIVINPITDPTERFGWQTFLGPRAFGSNIPVDTRSEMFLHEERIPGPGWSETERVMSFWQYAHETSADRNRATVVTQNVLGVPHSFIQLDDTSLFFDRSSPQFNQIRPQFAGGVVLRTVFEEGIYRLFDVNRYIGIQGGTQLDIRGSISHMQNGEGDDLFDLILDGPDAIITQADYTPIIPQIEVGGSIYRATYTRAPMDLYQAFIYNPGEGIDNRFVRFGYELIGFRATTNFNDISGFAHAFEFDGVDYHYSPVMTRDYLQGGPLFTHEYVAFSSSQRPRPVMLTPIWRAINVRFDVLDNTFNFNHGRPINTGWTNGAMNSIGMTVGAQFETNINLPLLRTPLDEAEHHIGFDWRLNNGSFMAGNQMDWTSFAGFRIGGSPITVPNWRELFENPDNFDPIAYNPSNNATWPRVILRPLWREANRVTFNFHLIHRDAESNLTTPDLGNLPMDPGGRAGYLVMAMKPTMEFVTQIGIVITAAEYDAFVEGGSPPSGHWRYVTETGITTPGMQYETTQFRLPTLADLANMTDLPIDVDQIGLRSYGWFFNQSLAANYRLGQSGETIRFINGLTNYVMNGTNRVVQPNQNVVNGGVTAQNGGISHLFLLYDYVSGSIQFDPAGGSPTPPQRNNVFHNEIINFTSAEMGVQRTGWVLLGWRYMGHILAGTTATVNMDPWGEMGLGGHLPAADRPIFNTTNPLTAQFPGGADGHILRMQAVWSDQPIVITFRNAAGVQYTGDNFINRPLHRDFVVRAGIPFMQTAPTLELPYSNDPLPVPTLAGHTFAGWYRNSALTIPLLSTDIAVNLAGYTLFARFVTDSFRFQFNLNTPDAGDAVIPTSRPQGAESGTANNGFLFGTTVPTLLPMLEDISNNPVTVDGNGRNFIGWALAHDDRTFVMDPRGVATGLSSVRLGSQNMWDATNNTWVADVNTVSLTAPHDPINSNGSHTYIITLFAVWSDSEVHLRYFDTIGGTQIGDPQIGFLFDSRLPRYFGTNSDGSPVQPGPIILGGDSARTWGPSGEAHFQWSIFHDSVGNTFGLMVRDDALLPSRPGYNFLGWLPAHHQFRNSENPIGHFPSWAPGVGSNWLLGRVFFPGEMMPSIAEGLDMIAVWAPYTTASPGDWNNLPEASRPVVWVSGVRHYVPTTHFAPTQILSISSTAVTPTFFATNQVTTNATHITFPRSLTVLGRGSITANNAIHIHMPTSPMVIHPLAITSTSLEWIYVNDYLVGVGNESTGGHVHNFVVGEVSEDGLVITTNFRRYLTRQGQLVLELREENGQPTNEIVYFSFENQTTKYYFPSLATYWFEDRNAWAFNTSLRRSQWHPPGILMTAGQTNELIGFPGNNTSFSHHSLALSGVTAIRSYAIALYANPHRDIFIAHAVGGSTFPDNIPIPQWSPKIHRHAFYHTNIARISLQNGGNQEVDPAFISGFNPNLHDVMWGPANSPHLEVRTFGHSSTGVTGLFHVPTNTLVYALSHGIDSGRGSILINTAVNANPYSLFRLAIPFEPSVSNDGTVTGIAFQSTISMGTSDGLFFEHFGVRLPNWVNTISINANEIEAVDWRLFQGILGIGSGFINEGIGFIISGTSTTNIINPSTGPDGQPYNRFPILVEPSVLAWYRANSGGVMYVQGNSRFIGRGGPNGEGLEIRYNRGTSDGSGNPTPNGANPGISTLASEIHVVDGLTFGQDHTIIDLPSHFARDGWAFSGWRVNLTAAQNTGLTAAQRAALGMNANPALQNWFLLQPGDVRRLGMIFDANAIFVGDYLVMVATWTQVLVNFMGRTAAGAATPIIPDRIQIYAGSGVWETSNMSDSRLGIAGTQIRLPGINHSFSNFGTRVAMVGWMQTGTNAPLAGNTWQWLQANTDTRILPVGPNAGFGGPTTFTLTNSVTFFHALYGNASPNISYTVVTGNVAGQHGFTATRNTAIEFDTNNSINIPTAAFDSATGFMRPVTRIADRAFLNPWNQNPSVVSAGIRIGENVQVIGASAFQMVPATFITFDSGAGNPNYTGSFLGTLPSLVIGEAAFAYNTRVTEIWIGLNVTQIGASAFLENINLHTIWGQNLTSELTSIGASAFESTRALTNFHIPGSVTEIGRFAFALSGIQTFTTGHSMASTTWHGVGAARYQFVAIGGHLTQRFYNGNHDLFVYAPGRTDANFNMSALRGTQSAVAYSVNRIAPFAFAHHRHLQSIFIPETAPRTGGIAGDITVTVGESAFAHMNRLVNLFLANTNPATFRTVGTAQPFRHFPNALIRMVIPPANIHTLAVGTLPGTWTPAIAATLTAWQGHNWGGFIVSAQIVAG